MGWKCPTLSLCEFRTEPCHLTADADGDAIQKVHDLEQSANRYMGLSEAQSPWYHTQPFIPSSCYLAAPRRATVKQRFLVRNDGSRVDGAAQCSILLRLVFSGSAGTQVPNSDIS